MSDDGTITDQKLTLQTTKKLPNRKIGHTDLRSASLGLLEILERATGIEPVSSAWKAEVLPLHNARNLRPHSADGGQVQGAPIDGTGISWSNFRVSRSDDAYVIYGPLWSCRGLEPLFC